MFTFDPYLDRDESGVAIGINVSCTDVTDRDLAQLGRFPRLRSISLSFTEIGDAGLVHLQHLSELELLNLAHSAVSDVGLRCLKSLARLEFLNLIAAAITDAGVGELELLKSLKELYLNDTQITRKGHARLLEALPGCHVSFGPIRDLVSERLRAISSFERRRLAFFKAFRAGRELGIDLDRDRLCRTFKIKTRSRKDRVVNAEELVGVIEGEVSDWNEFGPGSSVKLAFCCPECGHVQWGDFLADEENPTLWYSECACIDKWLIYWQIRDVTPWDSADSGDTNRC